MEINQEKKLELKRIKSRVIVALVASLTLGLAPFFPEPHLIGKWRWLLGGAEGMVMMDWLDLAMHTIPWIFLFLFVFQWFTHARTAK